MKAAPQIKGWCPSAWRPMLTGDGYLVRLHFPCGILASEQAHAVADLAQRFGNGLIDLTRRANLQIRGVAEERIAGLQAELPASGLVAPDASGADIPTVIASPLAGRDCTALLDIRAIVRELEQHFAHDSRARGLPAKFCISVDDGGRFSLQDVAADIGFETCSGVRFAVRVGGEIVGVIATDEIAETALAMAAAFISLRIVPNARRMRDLVERIGTDPITTSCPALRRTSTKANAQRRAVDKRSKPGDHALGIIAHDVLGVAAPFGSLRADQLRFLANIADDHADRELRLTPWRAILIPAIGAGVLDRLEAECARAGLITDAADPRRHIAACPGAPACVSASVATRDVAAALAPLLRSPDTLHVSGCAKSCASSMPAAITLVGAEGGFDLVRNGKPGDTPTLLGLSAEDVRRAIGHIAAEDLVHV